jgi:hypothetical protein
MENKESTKNRILKEGKCTKQRQKNSREEPGNITSYIGYPQCEARPGV